MFLFDMTRKIWRFSPSMVTGKKIKIFFLSHILLSENTAEGRYCKRDDYTALAINCGAFLRESS